jgi:hypothetical protein
MSTIETRNTSGFPRNAHQHRAAAQKHLALTEAAARFGQMNGWRQTDRGFRVCDIGRQSGDSHRTLDRDVRSLPLASRRPQVRRDCRPTLWARDPSRSFEDSQTAWCCLPRAAIRVFVLPFSGSDQALRLCEDRPSHRLATRPDERLGQGVGRQQCPLGVSVLRHRLQADRPDAGRNWICSWRCHIRQAASITRAMATIVFGS